MITVVPYDPAWPKHFATVSSWLSSVLADVPFESIEHVGSTSVPGLCAKPILDVDVIVQREHLAPALSTLHAAGCILHGDRGLVDREAVQPPPELFARLPQGLGVHVYVCVAGTVHLRNHLAVRSALRENTELRDEYAAVKMELGAQDDMYIEKYVSGKSEVVLRILAGSDLTDEDKDTIYGLNDLDTVTKRLGLKVQA